MHEAARSCGVGAEVAATVSELAFPFLKSPVSRVTGYDTVMPYFKNEHYYMPSTAQIASVAREMVVMGQSAGLEKTNKEVSHG